MRVTPALLACAVLTLTSTSILAAELERSAALSPDKTKLVRERQTSNGVILELVEVANGTSKPLVRLPGENRWPVWSPDGLFVAFCALFHQRTFITVTDMTGHSWLVQEIKGGLTTISWSPDAVWLIYSAQVAEANRDLFIASAGGTDIRNLTNTPQTSENGAQWSGTDNKIDYQISTDNGLKPESAQLDPFAAAEH